MTHAQANKIAQSKVSAMEQKAVKMYYDYVNNFLTVSRFAEHYGITETLANILINIGRKVSQG